MIFTDVALPQPGKVAVAPTLGSRENHPATESFLTFLVAVLTQNVAKNAKKALCQLALTINIHPL